LKPETIIDIKDGLASSWSQSFTRSSSYSCLHWTWPNTLALTLSISTRTSTK